MLLKLIEEKLLLYVLFLQATFYMFILYFS